MDHVQCLNLTESKTQALIKPFPILPHGQFKFTEQSGIGPEMKRTLFIAWVFPINLYVKYSTILLSDCDYLHYRFYGLTIRI
jgi:hypothetical protein